MWHIRVLNSRHLVSMAITDELCMATAERRRGAMANRMCEPKKYAKNAYIVLTDMGKCDDVAIDCEQTGDESGVPICSSWK